MSVSDSQMFSFCDATQATDTGSAFYLHYSDYPATIRSSEINCACSVETTSCSSQINIRSIHFQLTDGSGACTGSQKLHIDDGKENVVTYTCNDNGLFAISILHTVNSNYLKITLDNPDGTSDGYLWLGIAGKFLYLDAI